VAVDKGYYGALEMETVIAQIDCLPETVDGRRSHSSLSTRTPFRASPVC